MATYKTLKGRPLLYFYSIDIETDGDTQRVFFNSTIHVNRRVELPTSYSTKYSHAEILHQDILVRQINERFGKVTKPDPEGPF